MKEQSSNPTHSKRKGEAWQAPGSAIFSVQAWIQIAASLDLSNRELQIIHGMFDDQTELAIARNLGISPHTVHTHINRLHQKLRVNNRVQLILRVTNEFLALSSSPQNPLLLPLCADQAAARLPSGRH